MSLTIVVFTISPNAGEKERRRNSRLVLLFTLLNVTSVVTVTVMVGVMVMDVVGAVVRLDVVGLDVVGFIVVGLDGLSVGD